MAAPIVAKFMEKNFKGQWVSRGVTSTIFARLTEGSGVLLMSVFKLQNTVSAAREQGTISCMTCSKYFNGPPLQLQGALYDEGWWRTMIARRDNAFENGKMNFPRLLTIINEGRTRKGAYIQLNGMLMPLHTAAGTDESAVEKARRERSAPQKAIRKQFLDADRNSMLDQQHAVRREMESKARAALEAQLIPEEDFEASGPSLMRRAKSKAKAKGRTMAAGSKVQGAATVRPQQGPAIKATKVIKSKLPLCARLYPAPAITSCTRSPHRWQRPRGCPSSCESTHDMSLMVQVSAAPKRTAIRSVPGTPARRRPAV